MIGEHAETEERVGRTQSLPFSSKELEDGGMVKPRGSIAPCLHCPLTALCEPLISYHIPVYTRNVILED